MPIMPVGRGEGSGEWGAGDPRTPAREARALCLPLEGAAGPGLEALAGLGEDGVSWELAIVF